jgi:hypothetical protein
MQDGQRLLQTKSEEVMDLMMISDDVKKIKGSLSEFFLEWVQSDTEPELTERRTKVFHYRVIMEVLSHAEALQDADR